VLGLAFDGYGNLYVTAQYTGRIEKFSPTGTDLGIVAYVLIVDVPPLDVAVDGAGNIYETEADNVVEKFTSTGTDLGQFASGKGVAVDAENNVYVVDQGAGTVIEYSSSGTVIRTIASNLINPFGVALDASGNVYVTNQNGTTVEEFSPTGVDLGTFASGFAGTNFIGTAPADAASVSFTAPANTGGLPITSYTVNSVLGNLTASGNTSPITITGLIAGTSYTFTVTATNSIGTSTNSVASSPITLVAPSTIPGAPTITSVAPVDFVYVSDSGSGNVYKYTTTGTNLGVFVSGLNNPTGVAVDSAGNVYVGNSYGSIEEYTSTGTDLGVFVSGGYGVSGPLGLAFDSSGYFYIAAEYTGRVEKISPTGTDLGPFTTALPIDVPPLDVKVDGVGAVYISYGTGVIEKFSSSAADLGEFAPGSGIALDGAGDVYISNQGAGTVIEYSSSGTVIRTIASSLTNPFGVALDGAGNVYVTNQNGTTVEEFSPTGVDLGTFATGFAGTNFIATAPGNSAVVSFTAPTNTGGLPITSYIVKSSVGNLTATGSSSPITITGLLAGTNYTFTVSATNADGTGPSSVATP
jgi:sugar lactone lactonase YvrE